MIVFAIVIAVHRSGHAEEDVADQYGARCDTSSNRSWARRLLLLLVSVLAASRSSSSCSSLPPPSSISDSDLDDLMSVNVLSSMQQTSPRRGSRHWRRGSRVHHKANNMPTCLFQFRCLPLSVRSIRCKLRHALSVNVRTTRLLCVAACSASTRRSRSADSVTPPRENASDLRNMKPAKLSFASCEFGKFIHLLAPRWCSRDVADRLYALFPVSGARRRRPVFASAPASSRAS
jgi:hypothetical protein